MKPQEPCSPPKREAPVLETESSRTPPHVCLDSTGGQVEVDQDLKKIVELEKDEPAALLLVVPSLIFMFAKRLKMFFFKKAELM